MSDVQLRLVIFEDLVERFKGDETVFVGLQGDKIVVMQKGGQHFAVLVHPAIVGAPS